MLKPIFFGISVFSILSSLAHADVVNPVDKYREQGYSVQLITPIFSQLLAMSFPQGFKIVFENARHQQYIQESVLEGEDVHKWTQMITISGAKDQASNPNMTPKKIVENVASGFKFFCPDSFSAIGVPLEKISGFDTFSAIVSCGLLPLTSGLTSESTLILAIKGERDLYTIQWAERTMPSKTPIVIDKTKWMANLRKLFPIKLCPVVSGESEPYPSCIDKK